MLALMIDCLLVDWIDVLKLVVVTIMHGIYRVVDRLAGLPAILLQPRLQS